MADKKKTVSVAELDRVIKEQLEGSVVAVNGVKWLGLTIEVKNFIGLNEVVQLAEEVAGNSFLADGEGFIPEVTEFCFRKAVIEHYTNIRLPQNAGKIYDIVFGTDLYHVIREHIDEDQLVDLRSAVDEKIDHRRDMQLSTERARLNELIAQFNAIGENIEKLFGGVSGDDVRELVNAIGKSGIDEEKLMQQYLDRKYGAEGAKEE